MTTLYVIATCLPNNDVDGKDKGLISGMIKRKANKSLKSVTHTHGLRKVNSFCLFITCNDKKSDKQGLWVHIMNQGYKRNTQREINTSVSFPCAI